MILFYDNRTGEVYATIAGRVHNESQINCSVDNGIGTENIGKYIIGWEEKDGERIEHNMDKFELLYKFENTENPLDYKVINNELVEK